MSVDGVWFSNVGSRLELQERNGELVGTFDSVQQPGQAFPVHGSIYPDQGRVDRALSFSVAWEEAEATAKYRSVSSYTGQYHNVEGVGEYISVVFLLVNETTPARSFVSVHVGHDRFHRMPPSPERSELEQAMRERNQSEKM